MSKFKRIMSFLLVVLMILPIFLSTGSVLAKEMTEKPVITQENPKKEKEEVVIVDKTKDKSGEKDKESPKEEPQEDKVTIIDSEEENKETGVKEDKKPEVKEEKKESKEEPQDSKKEEVKVDINAKEKEIKDNLQTKSVKDSDSLMISENIVGQAVQGANDEVVTISDPKYFHIENGVVMGFVRAEDNQELYDEIYNLTHSYYNNKILKLVIPSGVRSIGEKAFQDIGINSVIIPEGVTDIDRYAFAKTGLQSVKLPKSLINIGEYAFVSNGLLTNISIPESVINIGEYAFAYCSIQEIDIPKDITKINKGIFSRNKLTNLIIPKGVTEIGEDAFNQNQLESVMLPEGIEIIGSGAFSSNKLTDITIPNSVRYLSGFSGNKLTNVTIPEGVTNIGYQAFNYNEITSVTIPETVTDIGIQAFSNNKLTSIDIPKYVTKIQQSAFENNLLESLVVPDNVRIIEVAAFNRNKLNKLVLPSTEITLGANSFGHNNLEYVKISQNTTIESYQSPFIYNTPNGEKPYTKVKLFTEDFARTYLKDMYNIEQGGHIILTKPKNIEIYKVDDTGKWNDKMRTSVFTLYGSGGVHKEDEKFEIFKQVISSIRIILVKQPDGSYKNYNTGNVEALPNGNLKLHQSSYWIDVGSNEEVANKIVAYNDWENIRRYDISNKTGGVHTLRNGSDFERNIKDATQIEAKNVQVHKKQENGKWWVQVEGDFIFDPDLMPKEDYLLDVVKTCRDRGLSSAKNHLNSLILSKYTMSEIKENPNYDYGAFLGLSGSKLNVIDEIERLSKDTKFIAERSNQEVSFLYATTLLENIDVKENKLPQTPYYYSTEQTPDEDGVVRFSVSEGSYMLSVKETQVPYGYEPEQESISLTPNKQSRIIFVNKRKDVKYRIKYLEEGTNKELHTSKEGQGKYTEVITEQAIDIKGYKLVGNSSQTFELDDVDNIKEYIFYYKPSDEATKKTLTVNYFIEGTTTPVPGIDNNPYFKANVQKGDIVKIDHPMVNNYEIIEGQIEKVTIGDDIDTVVNIYYKPNLEKKLIVNYYIKGTTTPVPGINPNPNIQINVNEGDNIPIQFPKANGYTPIEGQKNTVVIGEERNTIVNIYYEKERTQGFLLYKVQYFIIEDNQPEIARIFNKAVSSSDPFVRNVDTNVDTVFNDFPDDLKSQLRFVKIEQKLPFEVTKENNIINVYYEIPQENQSKNILVKKIDDNNKPLAGATISIYKKLEGDQSYERYIKETPIQSIETKDNGLALFENVDSDIVILETKSVERFNLNREVKSVDIVSYNGEEIIFKNHKITTKLPKTGTLGILPYILVSGLSVGIFIKLKKSKEN